MKREVVLLTLCLISAIKGKEETAELKELKIQLRLLSSKAKETQKSLKKFIEEQPKGTTTKCVDTTFDPKDQKYKSTDTSVKLSV